VNQNNMNKMGASEPVLCQARIDQSSLL